MQLIAESHFLKMHILVYNLLTKVNFTKGKNVLRLFIVNPQKYIEMAVVYFSTEKKTPSKNLYPSHTKPF